mgnify:FL=1
MSYNGVITISPSAARADMNKLSSAIEQLEQSRTAILQLQQCAEGMSGQTGAAIVEKAEELRIKIDRLNKNLVQSKQLIAKVVQDYQQRDAELGQNIIGRLL